MLIYTMQVSLEDGYHDLYLLKYAGTSKEDAVKAAKQLAEEYCEHPYNRTPEGFIFCTWEDGDILDETFIGVNFPRDKYNERHPNFWLDSAADYRNGGE